MAYGYNPSDYLMDFGWIGDIGKTLSATALKMPELIQLNREIKQNNKYKEEEFSRLNQAIDSMDEADIDAMKQSMNIVDKDANGNPIQPDSKRVREILKSRIPKYSDKMTNEEYGKMLATDFLTPFITAFDDGQDKGTGAKKLIGMFAKLGGATATAARQMPDVANVAALGQDKQRLEQAQGIQQAGAATERQTVQGEQTVREGLITDYVDSVMQMNPVDEVVATKKFSSLLKERLKVNEANGLTPEESTMVLQRIKSAMADKLNRDLRNKQIEADKAEKNRQAQAKTNPPVSPDVTANEATSAASRVQAAAAKLQAALSAPKKDQTAIKVAQDELKLAQDQLNMAQTRQQVFSAGGDYTVGGLGEATNIAKNKADYDRINSEMPFIKKTLDAIKKGDVLDPRKLTKDTKANKAAPKRTGDVATDGWNYLKSAGYDYLFNFDGKNITVKPEYGAWQGYLQSGGSLPQFNANTSGVSSSTNQSDSSDIYKQKAQLKVAAQELIRRYEAGERSSEITEARYNNAKTFLATQ